MNSKHIMLYLLYAVYKKCEEKKKKSDEGTFYKSFSIDFAISIGSVVGAKRSTGSPFLLTKNLVKFHLIALPKMPLCLSFKYLYSGWEASPLT